MKILTRLMAAGFALLVVILVAFYIYIDVIAGATIEKGATYALGVDTKVGFVRIGLLTGSFRIGSLEIDNPPGFEEKHLLRLGDGRLDVTIDSLQQEVVEIPVFALEGIDVDLEKAKGKTNFGVILANLERFESSGSKPAPAESGEAGSAKRFIVREVLIRDVSAHVEHTEGIGDLGAIDVAVPEIRLKNIGAHNARGVAMSELTNIIMKAIFEAIAVHGANLPGVLAGDLRAGLGGLTNVPIQVVGSATEAVTGKLPGPAGDAARQLGGDVEKKALESLGGLFGGKKDDE
jgi:hypothetical protein